MRNISETFRKKKLTMIAIAARSLFAFEKNVSIQAIVGADTITIAIALAIITRTRKFVRPSHENPSEYGMNQSRLRHAYNVMGSITTAN